MTQRTRCCAGSGSLATQRIIGGLESRGPCHPFGLSSLSSLRLPLCHPERSEGSALILSSDTIQLGAGSERSEGSAPGQSREQILRRSAPQDDKGSAPQSLP